MSYQVLARKWRPRTFEDMVGQAHVLQALTNALDHSRLHHAYLFSGTRGVGKTTLARILAKCVNCDKGVTSKPCGVCSACTGIDEGRFLDLIEVDAASRAKVEETRDLMDNVPYAPAVGRYKVYLIDEVHMFSEKSFNALLKTLEEPPPHVLFLLATTEANKIPITILSRCLQFNLKLLTVAQIEQQLERILREENIQSDPASTHLIAIAADGSLRDALSLLDQAIAYGAGSLDEAQVRSMLGTIDSIELMALLEALIQADPGAVLRQVAHMAEHYPDYDAVLVELLSLLQQIAVCQVVPDALPDAETTLRGMASRISREDVQLYYQIGLAGRRDLEYAPDVRSGFEMVLIRMLAFRPAQPVGWRQISQDPGTGTGTRAGETAVTSSPAGKTAPADTEAAEQDNWRDIIDEMALVGLVRELAGHCVLKEHTKDKVHLVLSPGKEHLLNTSQKERLLSALQTRFGDNIKVLITVEDPEAETPAERKAREARERQLAAEQAVADDPAVKMLQDMFDATIDRNSIRPNSD
ncbi:MAG: DNA polymerase III subunit gamma/tau [Gammaproteobacteria bacterium]